MKYFVAASAVTALLLGFSVRAQESSLKVNCQDSGGGYALSAAFDSGAPALTLVTTAPVSSTTQFLSPTTACGVSVDFSKNCKGHVRSRPGEWDFSFSCGNGVSGEVDFQNSELTFSCDGPSVDPQMKNAVVEGCAGDDKTRQ
jgi:hypothetical protein